MTKPLFTGALEPIAVGQELPISFDWVDRIPAGATIVAAEPTMLNGAECVTVDRVSVSGTVATFWIRGEAVGFSKFYMVATMSDGSKEGPHVSLRVR